MVNRPASSNDPDVPAFGAQSPSADGRPSSRGSAAGGVMAPQLWHMGVVAPKDTGWLPAAPFEGPSGYVAQGRSAASAMTEADIAETVQAFAQAAAAAKALGFDAVEIHGAHGYLIDQFFWHPTNQRTTATAGRHWQSARFSPWKSIRAVRQAVGADFPICLRISQWKLQDFAARLAARPRRWRRGCSTGGGGRGYLPLFATPILGAGVPRVGSEFCRMGQEADGQAHHHGGLGRTLRRLLWPPFRESPRHLVSWTSSCGVSTGEILTWWQSAAPCSPTPGGRRRSTRGCSELWLQQGSPRHAFVSSVCSQKQPLDGR